MKTGIFFFIGTEAELIKMFPVILECRANNAEYKIIASGQNDIVKSKILKVIDKIDVVLSSEMDIKKTAIGLLTWFMHTSYCAAKKIQNTIQDIDYSNSSMVVHGDTVSTLMGAYIGKKLGMEICHVEAGLRSHHLFNPFPEEIDRILTSKLAKIHFAPGDEPYQNLRRVKGNVINTKYNTIIDSLRYAMKLETKIEDIEKPYFVFVLHRQENLMNRNLTCEIVKEILKIAEKTKCITILHEITRIYFEKYDLIDKMKNCPNIVMVPRMNYFNFMRVLHDAEYVLTDGGSNQEELYYMGKPCLILRKTTERKEGLGENARLFQENVKRISEFAEQYRKHQISPILDEGYSPSKVIAEALCHKENKG